MRVEELTPAGAAEWSAYLEARADANCYHLLAWKHAAERAYGLACPFLVARDEPGGPLVGVLPLFLVRNLLGGYATTGLFGAYAPVLADAPEARHALLEAAARLTKAAGLSYLLHKSLGEETPGNGFKRDDHFAIATLPLDPDPEVVWKRFRSEIRNRTRKAERSGLVVQEGEGQLAAFYDVLAENMHRKGTPIYGIAVMRELLHGLGEHAEVLTLAKDGDVVSGALVVYYKGISYVPFVSSRQRAFQWNPNNLLYWEIIKRSCARGMRVLDFGRSPRDSSNLEFKLRFGAEAEPQPYWIYSPKGRQPQLDTGTTSAQRLIRVWQSLPRRVADSLGPAICRRFLA